MNNIEENEFENIDELDEIKEEELFENEGNVVEENNNAP